MTPSETALERQIAKVLHAKAEQVGVVPGTFEATGVTPDEDVRPRRARTLIAAVAVIVVVLVAGGAAALVRETRGEPSRQPSGPPSGAPVAELQIVALPSLTFQSREFTTAPGINRITLIAKGGSEAIRFSDPALGYFRIAAPGRHNSGKVQLRAGRDYRIESTIGGHRDAGMIATIHVIEPALAARVVLPAKRLASGATVLADVVVSNRTGKPLRGTGCGSPFQIVLSNDQVHQDVGWRLCAESIEIPVGISHHKVRVSAVSACGEGRGLSPCQAGKLPPLPPGTYRATLAQNPVFTPTPPTITIRVTRT